MRRFNRYIAYLIPFIIPAAASAHDFWLQPLSWQAIPGVPMPFVVEIGHGTFRQQWGADGGHLLELQDRAQSGSTDLRSLFKPGGTVPHLTEAFKRPGLHIVSLASTNASSNLPSIRFNDYIAVEGLTPAIEARARAGATSSNGRELYTRRAKALVQVGAATPGDDALAIKPIGLTLEIVPLRNPYSLGADHILPVQIFYEGHPLSGALVKLTNLEFDARPVSTMLSDASGRANFRVPSVGSWLVNVIWTKPIKSPDADFQTVFSSLTFGYSAKRAH